MLRPLALLSLIALTVPVCAVAATAPAPATKAAAPLPDLVEAVPARGFFEAPVEVRLEAPQGGTQIRFTVDGSEPTPTRGQVYTAPLRLAHPTVLRAALFQEGKRVSAVSTHSYLFLEDVLHQAKEQPGLPATWNGFPAAYAMDPRVVEDPAYAPAMKASLRSLPTLSVVCPTPDLFSSSRGLYVNSVQRGDDWERAASLEWIPVDRSAGFQVDCGLQMQGNMVRIPDKSPKHAFRVVFKDKYGPDKLKFPLFPDSPVKSFNTLVLRAGFNNTWLHWDATQRDRAHPSRDGWLKDSFRTMGWLTTHDRYVHLYLNGLYWGLYDVSERPDGAFASSYLGGKKDDYDVINESEIKGGTRDAFARLLGSMRGLSNPERYAAVLPQLEMTRFIDYLLLNYYAGNNDWGETKNWYALRSREPAGAFLYFVWDGEHIFEGLTDDTIRSPYEGPIRFVRELMASPDFRLAFADRVQRHCFNGGALTPESATARWIARAKQIDLAIIAESARWGYYRRRAPFTRNDDWLAEHRRLLKEYFPRRTDILLRQLRSAGLFPDLAAPTVQKPAAGEAPPGRVAFIAPDRGEIYFTTDGTDPRQMGAGTVSPKARRYSEAITLQASEKLKARVLNGQTWSPLTEVGQ